MTDSSSSKQSNVVLRSRLRRYLPYLGIYAADVREAIEELERMERLLAVETRAPRILAPLWSGDPPGSECAPAVETTSTPGEKS